MEQIAGLSPRGKARLAGVFEALEGLPAAFGQTIVLGMVAVGGDAAATAHNILTHETLYRLGFAIPLLAVGFHITWVLLFYQLFKPVNRTINLLAAFAMLVGCAVQALAALVYLAPLVILQSGSSLEAFNPAQRQDLALVFVNLSHQTFNVYLIFFGLWCVLAGYLIFNSTFMPRILGVLLVLDGLGWMTYLWPPFAASIFPVIAIVAGFAELPLQLWLIVFGVDSRRWTERARAADETGPDRTQRDRLSPAATELSA